MRPVTSAVVKPNLAGVNANMSFLNARKETKSLG
jgi:hypothetical protein